MVQAYIVFIKNIAKRRESKILLYALPIGLLILGINPYINSPLRVHNVLTTHKDDIAEECRDFYKLN
tara:strand:- start:247 stop:447 length:201 start_codon:yes stop_codon:yes gene_type:complete